MKFLSLLVLVFPLISLGAPCNGAPGKNHKNPDGSVGGFVSETASVSTTATVDASSSVCERARVEGNVKIRSGSEVSGQALIEGNTSVSGSRIYSQARVLGNSVVTGSVICQASEINFNVINSDYYCQTDDPEPKHPGQLGKKTLLGIDSDVDGVRDDVEIFINNLGSNAQGRDNKSLRLVLKAYAKSMQNSFKNKESANLFDFYLEERKLRRCVKETTEKLLINDPKIEKKIMFEFYNTEDRLMNYLIVQGSAGGKIIDSEKLRSNCSVY